MREKIDVTAYSESDSSVASSDEGDEEAFYSSDSDSEGPSTRPTAPLLDALSFCNINIQATCYPIIIFIIFIIM